MSVVKERKRTKEVSLSKCKLSGSARYMRHLHFFASSPLRRDTAPVLDAC